MRAAAATASDVDLLINNAGIALGTPLLAAADLHGAHAEMETNYFGPLRMTRAFAPSLGRRGGGVIINTTSIAGLRGFGTFSSYVASKFAVEGLTRSVAQEVAGADIRVNSIAPGPIDTAMLNRTTNGDHSLFTQMSPLQRAGKVEEVAGIVTFLASDSSSYVTGHTLVVDGGLMS